MAQFRLSRLLAAAGLLGLALLPGLARPAAAQTSPAQYFPETQHWVQGAFLTYWNAHGGLAQQGYPLTEAFQEVDPLDGKTYTVQYFERVVFELHPENAGTPFEVLLSQLGTFQYAGRYPQGAPNQQAPAGGQRFPQTGQTVGGAFLAYWQSHGGLAQQGYPISGEFTEVSPLDGKPYTVQYFERAVFERHPENAPPFDVLLAQIGAFTLAGRYPNNSNPAAAPVAAGTPPAQTPIALPTAPPTPPAAPATATPMPTPAPFGGAMSGYAASAFMTVLVVKQHQDQAVVGDLTRHGAPFVNAPMHAIWHFTYGDVACDATTNDAGMASCGLNIGGTKAGVLVVVDVIFTTPDGTIAARAGFTPNPRTPAKHPPTPTP